MAEKKNIKMVRTQEIRVLNPRARNQKKFKLIVENIAHVGLKKPIMVRELSFHWPTSSRYAK